MTFYKEKRILVTGGTGMIGRQLVELLIEHGAKVRIASLDNNSREHPQIEFIKLDLTKYDNCLIACKDIDFVFHLAGIKGSPKVMKEKPASYFVPSLLFTTNMMEAARKSGVKRFLFTSSVGVYPPAEIFYEEDASKNLPSENDLFGGWHKRTGELQAEAYFLEHGWKDIAVVRPANVYGPNDNFDPENAMVIPSLIKRAIDGEDPLVVWGDGSSIRDFIHAKDVARGMIMALEKSPGPKNPINLGSGKEYTIKDLLDIIISNLEKKPKVIWDISKPSGDKKRLMDISRAESLIGWKPEISLNEGIKEVMSWYSKNKNIVSDKYNVFTEDKKVDYVKPKKRVLICGATGFIGRNIIEKLIKDPEIELYGTYHNSEPLSYPEVKMIKADLRKKEEVDKVISGKDIVIHAAATTSGAKDIISKPHTHVTDNAIMSSLIMRSAFENKVEHFIFFSCTIMYQTSDNPLKEEDFNENQEIFKNYFGAGWTKVYLEKMCEFYSRISDTKYTVLRHSNVYGPHDKFDLEKSHVFGATITKVLKAKDEKVIIWGSGEEERDLIYIDDLVEAVKLSMENQTKKLELLNIGYGNSISISNLVKKIIEISGKDLKIEHDISKPTIKTKLCLDCTKAKNSIKWYPKTSLEEGIRKTIEWYKSNIL